jgi:hypothetical protein
MNHSEMNESIICVFFPLDRFLSLDLIYSVNSIKSYSFIRCRIVVSNTKLNLVYLCYLEKRYKTFYLRKKQLESKRSPDSKREKIALSERTRRLNEHYLSTLFRLAYSRLLIGAIFGSGPTALRSPTLG